MEHSPTELDLLRAELAELRQEVASMHATRTDRKVSADAALDDAPEVPSSNRRNFLRLAGAAAAGATAAAIASGAEPVAAATGGTMMIGQSNSPTAVDDTTRLFNPSAATLGDQTFRVDNYSIGLLTLPANHRIAVAGTTSGADTTVGSIRTGVYGRTSAPGTLGGQGVFGSSEGPENPFGSGFSFGVVGTGGSDGYGVFGYSPVGTGAIGVLGRADQGIGVIASSFTGVSLLVRDGGRIQQQLRATGAPAAGTFTIGEMIRDGVGDMYICTASGTPGTWRKVTAQHPSYANAGGSTNLLPRPIRLIDTRGNGAPITNGSVKLSPGVPLAAQITGTVADSLSVPAGAKGILGNLTITEANGSGFALVWPVGQPQPATSNINYSSTTASPAIANYFISAIDGAGKLNVMCSGSGTHLLLDVFGFLF